jgi:hypothetical protein
MDLLTFIVWLLHELSDTESPSVVLPPVIIASILYLCFRLSLWLAAPLPLPTHRQPGDPAELNMSIWTQTLLWKQDAVGLVQEAYTAVCLFRVPSPCYPW